MNTTTHAPSVSFADVEAAAQRLRNRVVHTSLIENVALNERLGARVLIKPEVLQHTGSFKFRGAYNRVVQFTPAQREAGIVAWSSGNHALAVSSVGARLGIQATILMPSDAPVAKIEGARKLGATVRLYDRKTENREAIGTEIAERTGAVIVPPYDDPHVIAGQGTLGIELIQQATALEATLDAALVSCSGGGLAAGFATAIHALSPNTAVWCVEPEQFDDTARSLAGGTRVGNPAGRQSICDALQVQSPGEITFPINQMLLAGALTVSDEDVRHAIRIAYEDLRLVVEPGGAAPLAALLAGKLDIRDKTIGIVLSGGNVDADKFATYIQQP
ncbi:MAG: threonine/serine dehydratase [Corticimicrobacter sp.]|uniref:threonine/serine dehydratase n=1 Tax=Corticimicrobacter sp. TaxID=2678536 RepID=UPI0032DB7791